MHFNSFFLKHLAIELNQNLISSNLQECFTQDKDELMIHFIKKNKEDFFIKFTLNPIFTSLSFNEVFARSTKNSTNIFQNIAGFKLKEVVSHLNERALSFVFNNNYVITLKFYGNRANAILFYKNEVIDLFKSKIKSDKNLKFNELDRTLEISIENYITNQGNLSKTIPTLGKEAIFFLNREFDTLFEQYQKQWNLVQKLLSTFGQSNFYIKIWEKKPTLSLVPYGGEIVQTCNSAIEACNAFYLNYVKFDVFDREKLALVTQVEKAIHKNNLAVKQLNKRILTFETGAKNDEIANIIMANLHQIPIKVSSIELFDFYRDENILIKLKPDISPQKNAENYYRKSKNEKTEIDFLKNSVAEKQMQVLSDLEQLETINRVTELKQLRLIAKTLSRITIAKTTDDFPFKETIFMGYQIWAGRNAQNSDLLTLKYAKKNDMWFHAKDVPGSHVVLKYKAGQNFPKPVLERAASIAAYNSKRKTDSLCPVIMTPKKHVRKTKNLAAGKVIVDKEEILMVEPMA